VAQSKYDIHMTDMRHSVKRVRVKTAVDGPYATVPSYLQERK